MRHLFNLHLCVTTPYFHASLLFSGWLHRHYYNMACKNYRLIQDEDVIDKVSMHHYERGLRFSTRGHVVSGVVAFTLAVSLITNVIFIMLHFRHGPHKVSSTTLLGCALHKSLVISSKP